MLNRSPSSYQLSFFKSKECVVNFTGGEITSDAGLLFLREVDHANGITDRLIQALPELRDERYIEHSLSDLVRQRIYQIVAGYEDCNDANFLKKDPTFKILVDRSLSDPDLASQPTLSRWENSLRNKDLLAVGESLMEYFLARTPVPPYSLVIDIDSTDDPTYGDQQLTFFNGYHEQYMYHPLLITCNGHLLSAVLRAGNAHASKGVITILKRLVQKLRSKWPHVKITFRADAGFAIPGFYEFCEQEEVTYFVGLITNPRLENLARALLQKAYQDYARTQQPQRLLEVMTYQAESWNHPRSIVVKAEVQSLGKDAQGADRIGENQRFVVTNHPYPLAIDYDFYVDRGESELWIKELKLGLCADRLSCQKFSANQFRLFLFAFAYELLRAFQSALRFTRWAKVQFSTLRQSLLKIGAQVIQSTRRICFRLSSSCPTQEVLMQLLSQTIPSG